MADEQLSPLGHEVEMTENAQQRARGLIRLLIFAHEDALEIGSNEAATLISEAIASLRFEFELNETCDLFGCLEH